MNEMKALVSKFRKINPWRLMLFYMATLALYGVYALGNPLGALTILAIALPFGVGLDYVLHKIGGSRPKFGQFPQSGLISSLIVSVLMPMGVSLPIVIAAVALAIGSKHYLRVKNEHIFNPASFGVASTVLMFGYPVGWWPDAYFPLVIMLGIINIWRVKKYWQVLGFGAVYAALLFVVYGVRITGIGLLPWFFMLFMLPEPVTSRPGPKKELIFGAIVAAFAIIFVRFDAAGPAALPLGLMVANLSRFVRLPSAKLTSKTVV